MIKYKELSDTELLEMHRSGDRWAFDEINERYKKTVKFHARFFYLTGGDEEDLLQEGMIGLFEATNTYKDDRNASFATFADKCIRSRIIKAVAFDNKKSNRPLNESVPIIKENEEITDDAGSVRNGAAESDNGEGNPERIVIDREMQRIIIEDISTKLSELERIIFKKYLAGMSLREIQNEAGISYKSADNALSRIKAKAKKVISKAE